MRNTNPYIMKDEYKEPSKKRNIVVKLLLLALIIVVALLLLKIYFKVITLEFNNETTSDINNIFKVYTNEGYYIDTAEEIDEGFYQIELKQGLYYYIATIDNTTYDREYIDVYVDSLVTFSDDNEWAMTI